MRVLWTLAVLCLAACDDPAGITETGNPELDVQVALQARLPDRRAAPPVDGAWAVIDDMKLSLAEVCDVPGEAEVEVGGPGVTDLLAVPPTVVTATVSEASYCRLRVRFDRADEVAGAPARLEDHALLLTGLTRSGTPFEIATRDKLEVDLRSGPEPFTIDEAQAHLVLAFDIATWIDGLGLDGLEREGGVILVNEDSNDDALEQFEEQAEAAMTLHPDDDADGTLDDSEADEVLAGG